MSQDEGSFEAELAAHLFYLFNFMSLFPNITDFMGSLEFLMNFLHSLCLHFLSPISVKLHGMSQLSHKHEVLAHFLQHFCYI